MKSRFQLWRRYDRLYNPLNRRSAIVLFDDGEAITVATGTGVMQGTYWDYQDRGWVNLGNPKTSADARIADLFRQWKQ